MYSKFILKLLLLFQWVDIHNTSIFIQLNGQQNLILNTYFNWIECVWCWSAFRFNVTGESSSTSSRRFAQCCSGSARKWTQRSIRSKTGSFFHWGIGWRSYILVKKSCELPSQQPKKAASPFILMRITINLLVIKEIRNSINIIILPPLKKICAMT
jgi:hypothetical protein